MYLGVTIKLNVPVVESGVLIADSFCADTALSAGVLHASSQVLIPDVRLFLLGCELHGATQLTVLSTAGVLPGSGNPVAMLKLDGVDGYIPEKIFEKVKFEEKKW